MPGKYAALVLSRGEQFEPPPLMAVAHGYHEWPTGPEVSVNTVFYDSAGGVIADIAGTVTSDKILFDTAPEDVDLVPAGAQYETFLIDGEAKKKQVRYGQVIRRQAQFFNTAARVTSNRALQFRDNFYTRTGLVGSKWFVTNGRPTIYDRGAEPNAVGPNFTFFTTAAMRFYAPLNSDSFVMSFNLMHIGAGDAAVIVASNAAMTSYLYVSFRDPGLLEGGIDTVRMGIGSGPIALNHQVAPVPHTVANNANYKLRYDDLTKRLSLLDAAMATEIVGWTDSDEIVPHGPGYRYFGMNWTASLFDLGFGLTTISAQDGIDA